MRQSLDDYSAEHKTDGYKKSKDAAASATSALAGNTNALFFKRSSMQALWKERAQDKTDHFSGCIFSRLARSHANMLVNNKFGLLYECSIFEASESAAVFAR